MVRQRDKKEWALFFDGVRGVPQGGQAEIPVLSPALGDQGAADRYRFLRIGQQIRRWLTRDRRDEHHGGNSPLFSSSIGSSCKIAPTSQPRSTTPRRHPAIF